MVDGKPQDPYQPPGARLTLPPSPEALARRRALRALGLLRVSLVMLAVQCALGFISPVPFIHHPYDVPLNTWVRGFVWSAAALAAVAAVVSCVAALFTLSRTLPQRRALALRSLAWLWVIVGFYRLLAATVSELFAEGLDLPPALETLVLAGKLACYASCVVVLHDASPRGSRRGRRARRIAALLLAIYAAGALLSLHWVAAQAVLEPIQVALFEGFVASAFVSAARLRGSLVEPAAEPSDE